MTLVDKFSWFLVDLFISACSLCSETSLHVSAMSLLVVNGGSWLDLVRRKYFNWRPRIMKAGDKPVVLSRVFLYWRMSLVTLGVSSFPVIYMFSLRSLFADLTANLTLVLACANPTDVSLWCTPYCWSKAFRFSDLNSGPPSLVMVSGTPMSWKSLVGMVTRPAASPFPSWMLNQLLNRSTTTAKLWP